jgi:hypothetical protein
MHEMITRGQADVFFGAVFAFGLILASVAGLVARRRGRDAFLAALLWGGPLVLIGVLWRVYNAITDRVGLDSVANLAINGIMFVVIGVGVGVGWQLLCGARSPAMALPAADAAPLVPDPAPDKPEIAADSEVSV